MEEDTTPSVKRFMYIQVGGSGLRRSLPIVCTMTPSPQMLEAARRCRAAQGQSGTLVRSRSASGPTTPHPRRGAHLARQVLLLVHGVGKLPLLELPQAARGEHWPAAVS